MADLLLMHGPNLNWLGRRDPEHYGTITLDQLENRVAEWGAEFGLAVRPFQSNHEGALIDQLQQAAAWAAAAIVNLGALSHSSYALHDALLDFGRPVVEVHLSSVHQRESWRRTSVIRPACVTAIEGQGVDGYRLALQTLARELGRDA